MAIADTLRAINEQSTTKLVESTNMVDIHRTQGGILAINELIELFEKPEIFNEFYKE